MVVYDSGANVDDSIWCDGNNEGYGSGGNDSRVHVLVLVLMLVQVLVKVMIYHMV